MGHVGGNRDREGTGATHGPLCPSVRPAALAGHEMRCPCSALSQGGQGPPRVLTGVRPGQEQGGQGGGLARTGTRESREGVQFWVYFGGRADRISRCGQPGGRVGRAPPAGGQSSCPCDRSVTFTPTLSAQMPPLLADVPGAVPAWVSSGDLTSCVHSEPQFPLFMHLWVQVSSRGPCTSLPAAPVHLTDQQASPPHRSLLGPTFLECPPGARCCQGTGETAEDKADPHPALVGQRGQQTAPARLLFLPKPSHAQHVLRAGPQCGLRAKNLTFSLGAGEGIRSINTQVPLSLGHIFSLFISPASQGPAGGVAGRCGVSPFRFCQSQGRSRAAWRPSLLPGAGLWPWGCLRWGPLTVPAECQAKTSPSSPCL